MVRDRTGALLYPVAGVKPNAWSAARGGARSSIAACVPRPDVLYIKSDCINIA